MTSDNVPAPHEGEISREIKWVEIQVHLSQLRPFEKNPRNITEDQYDKLKQSLLEDGYHSRIKVTQDMRLIGGHQRLRALRELGYEHIPVLAPTTSISDEQYVRIMLRDNHNNGLWDMDMLANEYDIGLLHDIGLHELMDIRPEEASQAGKKMVRCPNCSEIFPVKGNGHKEEL